MENMGEEEKKLFSNENGDSNTKFDEMMAFIDRNNLQYTVDENVNLFD